MKNIESYTIAYNFFNDMKQVWEVVQGVIHHKRMFWIYRYETTTGKCILAH